jgi:hypothetical protein
MQINVPHTWLIARLLVMLVIVASIVAILEERSNLDWGACFLISALTAGFLFGWLAAVRFKPGIDWSEPYSWQQPFLPMKRYPLRYWFLVSTSCMLAGAAAMMWRYVTHDACATTRKTTIPILSNILVGLLPPPTWN